MGQNFRTDCSKPGQHHSVDYCYCSWSHRNNKIVARKWCRCANLTSLEDMTPLHIAAYGGSTDIVRLLLNHGANVNAEDLNGNSALHFAARKGQTDVARLLLDRGANMEACALDGSTPLHVASSFGYIDFVGLMIERDANVHALNHHGGTPFDMAMRNHHQGIVALLKDAMIRCPDGWMPLHYAAAQGHLEAVKTLMERGQSVTAVDQSSKTPLEYAYENAQIEIIDFLGDSSPSPSIKRLHTIAIEILSTCDEQKVDRLLMNPEKYHITLHSEEANETTLLVTNLTAQHTPFNCYICQNDRVSSKRVVLPCNHTLCRDCESRIGVKPHGLKECGLCRGRY